MGMRAKTSRAYPRNAPPHPTCRKEPTGKKVSLVAMLLLLVLAALSWGLERPAGAEEKAAPPRGTPKVAPVGETRIGGLTNFDGCIHIALQQSPQVTKSSMEIQLKRLDEADSRWGMFPSVTLHTYYYLNRPQFVGWGTPRSYGVNFWFEPYNPLVSYFSLQAKKKITQIAIFNHLQVISDGIMRLARMFMELDLLKRSAALQDEIVNLSRQNLAYWENHLKLGTGTPLEVKIATQELEVAKIERERTATSQARGLENLRSFLGLKAGQEITPDLREVRRQVLGQFDPAAVTLAQVRDRSYDLKIMKLALDLQSYNIGIAKYNTLPNLFFGVQTPDPLSAAATGYYVSVGVDVPVWDGFKRIRNISRQKVVLKQMSTDKDQKEIDVKSRWDNTQEHLHNTAVALKMAQSQEELAQLKERQASIRYHAGEEGLPAFLTGRKAYLEAQRNTWSKSLDYDQAVLNLRQLSGDLMYTYVNASSFQD
jgi:outer membrane protein TolC